MSIFIVKAKKTALQSPLSTTATFITVRELVDSKGNALTMSHFGDWFVIAIKQGDKQEMIKCTNITQNSNGTATVTVATNGRNLDPTSPYVGYATGESFQSGEVIVTNDPLTLSVFAHLDNEQIWTETQTFEKAPIIEADGMEDNEAVRKSQLDNAVFGTPMITPVVFPGVAGETILVDKVVYLDEDGMWYLADAETVGKSENVILGISRGGGTTGNAIGGGVTIFGGHTASSAIFTANTHYYVSDTDGELSDTPGTLEVSLGVAKTTTLILLYPRYNQQLTEAIQDALQNPTSGTPLSADNGVVDEADTSTTPIANKIPRADADGSIDGWIQQYGKIQLPAGEAFTGATTPQTAFIVNDLFQPLINVMRTFGKQSVSAYRTAPYMTITPLATVTSTQVTTVLSKVGSPSDSIRIVIKDTSDNVITNGTSDNVAGSSLSTTSSTMQSFTFSSPFTLSGGTSYRIYLERTGGNSNSDFYHQGSYFPDSAVDSSYAGFNVHGHTSIPYLKITPTSGGSMSLYKTKANHNSPMARQVQGLVITTGGAGDIMTLVTKGKVGGFSSLLPYNDYYTHTTSGGIRTVVGGMYVGKSVSDTEIILDTERRDGIPFKCGYHITSSTSEGDINSGLVKFEAFSDGHVFIIDINASYPSDITISVNYLVSIRMKNCGYGNGLNQVTIPVKKGQSVSFSPNLNANAVAYAYFIPTL